MFSLKRLSPKESDSEAQCSKEKEQRSLPFLTEGRSEPGYWALSATSIRLLLLNLSGTLELLRSSAVLFAS